MVIHMQEKYETYEQLFDDLKEKYDVVQSFQIDRGNMIFIVEKGTTKPVAQYTGDYEKGYEKVI